ncbi:MAG: OsmC family protein [Cyclobacteriaceae bacterium]|nr:OsmC family protein [Cyclobacteriaceae bacterium]MCX7636542.1 OsmC family protein [Cyclobacteriaceae bacterium]MDW8330556.1 OsmC family protein [Cyclobacteriaceae bacterium]
MTTLTAVYEGDLRTRLNHTRSGQSFITDAPPDNQGKGEAFSPTDLVCAALASCMLTTMGIVAAREGIDMKGMKAEVLKIMTASPRKIAEIQITLYHPQLSATEAQKQKLRNTALSCPVALSLHDSVKQSVTFQF